MTDNPNGTLTRRSILRKGAITSVAIGASIPSYMGVVAASICPRTPGYWKNHDWPSTGLERVNLKLPVDFGSVEEGQEFLAENPRGDKGQIMARQLIATILNFQRTGDCYDVGTLIADVDGDGTTETFEEIKALSIDWLKASNFPDSQDVWSVPSAPVEDGEVLKDYLDQFNNNNLLPCSCAVDD